MLGATLDTTERRQAEEALRASHEQLRQLARRLDEVREEELTRISREIHDELGHALTALRLDLSWLVPKLRRNREPVRQKSAEMLALVDDTIDSVRRIASQLRPPVLEDLGLAAAIDARLERFAKQTGLQVELRAGTDEVPMAARRGLYRIVQEALTNVARHAQATAVVVRLECSPERVVLEIADDGVGIPPGTIDNPRSLGLVGMRERAAALGAEFQVEGGPGRGTTVRVGSAASGIGARMIRVMLADDHSVVREGIRRLLEERNGLTVVAEAATVPELLAELRRTPTDVVVLDIAMPGPGIVETLREVKSIQPRRAVARADGAAGSGLRGARDPRGRGGIPHQGSLARAARRGHPAGLPRRHVREPLAR